MMMRLLGAVLLCGIMVDAMHCAGGRGSGGSESGARDAVAPSALRTEHLVEPIGLAAAKPRLSWKISVRDDGRMRGVEQDAYQVQVGTDRDKLARGVADAWDSGRVASRGSEAEYAGAALVPHQRYFWRVRVWTKAGESSYAEPASFSAGVLDPSEWIGAWIGYDEPMAAATAAAAGKKDVMVLPPSRYLRGKIQLKGGIRSAVLYASALGLFEPYLNGERVGDEWFAPGWTDYKKRVYYRAYDVTAMVKPGANVLGAILGDGWYSGHVGWGHIRNHYGSDPRFSAMMVIQYGDGTTARFGTDASWRASTGPILESDFLMGETYDARKELRGWTLPQYKDSGWKPVVVGDAGGAKLEPHPGPPVEAFDALKPVATKSVGESWMIDFGQNFAGVVRLRVRGEAGRKITLRFAERLNPDGTIYTTNLRGARATDTFICGGGEEEIWQPSFTFHGFQYVEVSGWPGKPEPDAIVGLPLSSATPGAGSFVCSDPMLNKLWSNIRWTKRANFIDVPTDCPQRDERLGWTGDAQAFCRTATYVDDVQAFFTKWLVDLDDAQRADGQFPMVAPLKVAGDDGGPAWADAGVICPWTIYDAYGDRRLLEAHYASMVKFVEFCRGRSRENLLPPEKFHCFGDWVALGEDTPHEVIYTAYFAYVANLTSKAAAVLGRADDARKYADLARRVKDAFLGAYVAADGTVRGDTQCAYVLALAFDLMDEKRLPAAREKLVAKLKGRGWHLATGFVGTKDLMLVLDKIGRNDVAYRLAQNTTYPSWGFSIANGATSIWERWDGWTPEKNFQDPGMNSFAHYAFGAVGQWMVETIGGIRSTSPGFERIDVRPQPGGTVAWAKTELETPRGIVSTSWRVDGAKMELAVTVPPNAEAWIHIPTTKPESVREGDVEAKSAPGVVVVNTTADEVVLSAKSGKYLFRFDAPVVRVLAD